MDVIECFQGAGGADGDGVGAERIGAGAQQRPLHDVPGARVGVRGTGDVQPAGHARVKVMILDVVAAGNVSVNLNRTPGAAAVIHVKNGVGHDLYLPLDVNDSRIAVVKLAAIHDQQRKRHRGGTAW